MNREEMHRKYGIPLTILKKYEKSPLANLQLIKNMAVYDDYALRQLEIIMSLLEFGLSWDEIGCYIKREKEGKYYSCMDLLSKKHNDILKNIHSKEQIVARIDYLNYKLKRMDEKKF